jgi:hypothetical protein
MTAVAAIMADFRTDPYLHQLREFERSAELPARALLWQQRTGKTKLTIDTACHLARKGEVDAVVLLAPNGVHENWTRRELPKHHWSSVPRSSLAWRTSVAGTAAGKETSWLSREARELWREEHAAWWAEAKEMLEAPELAWFAFSSESMIRPDVRRLIARVVKHRRVLVVADESDDFRTPGSKRTKMARAFFKRCAYRRILTASVITNSPLAAFSQYELLEPGALGFSTYADFKQHIAVYETLRTRAGRHYPKLKEYVNLDELRESMAAWSSVVLRDDCADLPDVVQEVRCVEPSDEQLRLYRELHRQFTVDLDGEEVSIGENTTRIGKLQQVLSGFLIDEYGDVHNVPGVNPRLEALSDEVYLSAGKVIVWCQFREDIDRVAARLRADGHEIVEYHGRVSDEDKQRNLDRFQNVRLVKGIVGQPGAGGRGLDMSAASEIHNYSHTFNAIHRAHSVERATAIAGKNIRMVDYVAPGPDEYIREQVDGKIAVADSVAGEGMREFLRRCEL